MQSKWYKAAVLAALAVAAVFALTGRKPAAEEGKPAPAKASAPKPALPKLVDLGADKCIPCKMMAPILEELRKEQAGKVGVQFVDVWKNPDAAKQYGINVIPTQIFYDAKGKEFLRHEGFFPKEEILKAFKKQGVVVAEPKKADDKKTPAGLGKPDK